MADKELFDFEIINQKFVQLLVQLLDQDHFKHFKQNFGNYWTRTITFCDIIVRFYSVQCHTCDILGKVEILEHTKGLGPDEA